MKIILIGANGKIGELVQKAMAGAGHEIVKVGRRSGESTQNDESLGAWIYFETNEPIG